MAVYVAVPKLGMALANATVVEWKAAEGDRVEKGQPLVTIETQKTKVDLEAEAAGRLHILVAPESEVAVGRVIGLIAESESELAALQEEPAREISVALPEGQPLPQQAIPTESRRTPSRGDDTGRIKISPLARKLAEEHMIDISKVVGTGPEGRIVKEDIERAIASVGPGRAPQEAYDGRRIKTTVPLRGMRKAIAEHMQRSLAVSAQLTAIGEIDMTGVLQLRSQLEKTGVRPGVTDIILAVLARVLREFPVVNSSLIDNEIKIWDSINLGVAVALDDGLIVPVIRDADRMSLVEIGRAVQELSEKARQGKLSPHEVTGGTFTLTNLGALGAGWRFETAIINQPESAILGTGGITERAVVKNGQIVIRPVMAYSFTYDHRVIDGAVAVKFMARLTELIESPVLLLTDSALLRG